jgi:hypothetical protein
MSEERQTFQVGEYDEAHEIGNPNCDQGWCGDGTGYPVPCECGGFIHADFGDENADGDYWLYQRCDRCGGDYRHRA